MNARERAAQSARQSKGCHARVGAKWQAARRWGGRAASLKGFYRRNDVGGSYRIVPVCRTNCPWKNINASQDLEIQHDGHLLKPKQWHRADCSSLDLPTVKWWISRTCEKQDSARHSFPKCTIILRQMAARRHC
jgi:hypothetical protein